MAVLAARAQPVHRSAHQRLAQEGEEHDNGLPGAHSPPGHPGGHLHQGPAQGALVAIVPGPGRAEHPLLGIGVGGHPLAGVAPDRLGVASADVSDPVAQPVLDGVGVGHPYEGAGHLHVSRSGRGPLVHGRLGHGTADTGLGGQAHGGRARDDLGALPPAVGAVGRVGGGLRREHDIVPTLMAQLGRRRILRPRHQHAQALAHGAGGNAQPLVVQLRNGAQGVAGGVAHGDDDNEAHRGQAVAVDGTRVGEHTRAPLVHPHHEGVAEVVVRLRLGPGLQPVERGEETGAGQVYESGQEGALARRGDEDDGVVPVGAGGGRGGHSRGAHPQYSSPSKAPGASTAPAAFIGSTTARISRTELSSWRISSARSTVSGVVRTRSRLR